MGYRRMRTLLDLQLARDLSRDSNLSESDYDVLSTLSEVPRQGWRSTDLADRLSWSTSRLAHHVGRMEHRGLVIRDDCEDDRRGASISLTNEGKVVLDRAAPLHVASVRRNLFNLLTPEDVRALAAISTKVNSHLNQKIHS